jgi:hypothetical protein
VESVSRQQARIFTSHANLGAVFVDMNSLIVRRYLIYSTRHVSPDIDSGKSPSQ